MLTTSWRNLELFSWKTWRQCEESIHIQSIPIVYTIYIYIIYNIHKYTVSSFNYSVTISEHTQDLHRAPIPKSPSQDSGIMPVVGLLLCRDLLISSVRHAPSQYMTSMPTPKREYSRKCIQHSHIRVMRTMQAVQCGVFLGSISLGLAGFRVLAKGVGGCRD